MRGGLKGVTNVSVACDCADLAGVDGSIEWLTGEKCKAALALGGSLPHGCRQRATMMRSATASEQVGPREEHAAATSAPEPRLQKGLVGQGVASVLLLRWARWMAPAAVAREMRADSAALSAHLVPVVQACLYRTGRKLDASGGKVWLSLMEGGPGVARGFVCASDSIAFAGGAARRRQRGKGDAPGGDYGRGRLQSSERRGYG